MLRMNFSAEKPPLRKTAKRIANGRTTLRTLNRRPKLKQKANHFDNYTTSKPTLIAYPSVFFIFSTTLFLIQISEAIHEHL